MQVGGGEGGLVCVYLIICISYNNNRNTKPNNMSDSYYLVNVYYYSWDVHTRICYPLKDCRLLLPLSLQSGVIIHTFMRQEVRIREVPISLEVILV